MMETKILDQLQELKQLALLGAKNVLTVEDLSLLTGLSKSHIYKLVCSKRIPYYKNSGGKLTFFRKAEIEDWLCAFRVPTADETEQQAIKHCVTTKTKRK